MVHALSLSCPKSPSPDRESTRDRHSGKRPLIKDSPVFSDDVAEIGTEKLAPRHSGNRPRLEDTIVHSDDDHHKQIETHKGIYFWKSEKQKAPASCPKCRRRRDRRRARTEKPPLPEGYGYLCSGVGVDENGHYYEVRSDLVGYMSCLRCGVDGDHWDPYCPNPINDPPESEETAAARLSWKYILRDFNRKHQIDKEIEAHKGGVEIERHCIDDNSGRGSFKAPHLKDTIHADDLLGAYDKEIVPHKGEVSITAHKQKGLPCPKCRRRRDHRRARTEKPPLPEGYGYLCSGVGVDENGHYYEVRSDLVGYMSCLRCGMDGDHWDPYCPNPINDPPESEETAAARLSWKYILRDFNRKPH
ncbi:hypothetical protein M0R45_002545 [Rubus argutus]|uniref:CCHC-type domain-containing protein n=1 Tax=Rubus argutus TaxID=59490 RepID=A0AAW1VRA6_RUBAR